MGLIVAAVVCRLTFFLLVTILFLFAQAVRVMVDYWLGVWVDHQYHLSTKIYVISYACLAAGAIVLSLSRGLLFTEATMVSAKQMHGRMAERVLRSPQLFFDQVIILYSKSPSFWALLFKSGLPAQDVGEFVPSCRLMIFWSLVVVQNPVGRIVNRFSKDQSLVDELLPSTAQVRHSL